MERKMLNTGNAATAEYPGQNRIVRDGHAISRLEAERQRIAKLKGDATPPAECGWLIPSAPGRGGFVTFMPASMQLNAKGKWEKQPSGYAGRHAVRAADVFDQMIAAAERAKKGWPLTPGQIAIGRRYRDLVEWRAAGAIKCSTIDGRVAGSGERDFMDAYLSAGRELDGMRRRIGTGIAMQVRRIRPSQRGKAEAVPIRDSVLIEMVCIQQKHLSDVLKAHYWSTYGGNRKAIREALCAALDRMIGYLPEKRC
ncbi:hypothetical protein D3P04_03365 [Paracoccus onubensis]|uniref:Uncharacterized protein n=2 Tax=Paracoccus onubensis TaxID=1675788 RepID=A0A418T432_9RHOB|nr:hypothetical protein D3P04_03365 [Paracoccus onubensis]